MKPEARDQQYDAIVVGARCAGATVATVLAGAGRRVLLVDRDTFPSDTVSTHQLFPDSLELLDRLGAGDRLRAAHRLRPVDYSWRVLGHAVAGTFTPIGGHDRTCSIRRVSLDAVLVDTATAAGAELRLGAQVEELIGAGTDDDPVRGVVLGGGERLPARWVIGADGRTSTVAHRLQLSSTEHRRGEMSMLFAYWEGLPDSAWCQIDVQESLALMSAPCEDGVHLLAINGPADLTRGSATGRQQKYLAALRRFPATLNPRLLEQGQQIAPVIAVPETMLRGFVRPASGPGWALVGDAGLFKHPVTANGIGDALAHGWYVGNALSRGDDLADYEAWRDERSAGHYDFSFETARFPAPGSAAVYQGLAEDPTARQEFLDLFAKRHRPADVLTANRLARWRAAGAYLQGVDAVSALVEGLDDEALEIVVPACPDWRIRDLLAHLVGVAEDSADGGYFAAAMDAWRTPAYAAAREVWTAGHVDRHRHRTRDDLVGRLSRYGSDWAGLLRRGAGLVGQAPPWLVAAPAADLSVHLVDLAEAIGQPAESGSAISRFGFAAYRQWLGQRLIHQQLPALLFRDGRHDWPVGRGAPAGTVTAPADELFRMITGRRSRDEIRRYDWSVDPTPYLAVISPYPLPT